MSGSEYPTLGMVIPVYFSLMAHTKKAVEAVTGFRSTHTMKFATSVQYKLQEYDGKIRNKMTRIASALDPRIKSLLENVGISKKTVEEEISAEWEAKYKARFSMKLAQRSTDAAATIDSLSSARSTSSAMASMMQILKAPSSTSEDVHIEPSLSDGLRTSQ